MALEAIKNQLMKRDDLTQSEAEDVVAEILADAEEAIQNNDMTALEDALLDHDLDLDHEMDLLLALM